MTPKPETNRKEKPATEPTKETSGEGNREADRRYREQASRYADSPESKRAAQEAERALEDEDEAQELEDAEQEGRSRARSTHDQRGEP